MAYAYFFLISGYLASKSKKIHSFTFIRGKFFRLLYVWFIWRQMEWIFMRFRFSGLLPFNSYVPKDFLGNLKFCFTSPCRPLWFVFDLFVFFLILWVTEKVSFNIKPLWYSLLLLSVPALYYICTFLAKKKFLDSSVASYDSKFLFYFIIAFLFGKCLSSCENNEKKYKLITSSIICSFVGYFIFKYYIKIQTVSDWLRSIAFCIFVVFLMKYVEKTDKLSFIKKALIFLGKYSLEYYVLQFLCLNCGFWISNANLRFIFNIISTLLICSVLIFVIKKFFPLLDKLLWGNFTFKENTKSTIHTSQD